VGNFKPNISDICANLQMPKKILVIRFSSIGDIVLTTPVIRCLKQQLPGAEIHFATKKQYVSVLEANPYISKIHVFEDKKLPTHVQQLSDEKFDLLIDLHNNLRSFLIRSNLNIENRRFNKINFQKWLMVNFKINILPEKHIVDRYLECVKDHGVINDGKGLDHFIPQKDLVDITSLPPQFKNGYYAFVIGAMHFTKKLPLEKAIALCAELSKPIVLIGGKEDIEKGEKIAASNPNKIFNACGKFNINQSASIIEQSLLVIAHDTGMMHIAAALKKDIISIWGNTIPEFGMYPYFGNNNDLKSQRNYHKIMEVTSLSCRPCSKIGFDACPKGHFNCMYQIDLSTLKSL
jgi:ADP-heptose:LPS heptosyltransferase